MTAMRLPPAIQRRWRRSGEALAFYGFISPWLIGTALLSIFPLGYAIYLSFTNWDGITPNKPWAGLANYKELLSSGDALASLGRTMLLVAIVVPATVVGSLVLALLLNERLRGRVVFRVLIFIPAIVPPVAASLIWKVIFDQNSGSANRLLETFGARAISWLTGSHAFISLVVVMLWAIGAGIIIDLAALQTVDPELQEAAKLDGAGPFRAFLNVTLPAISPVLLFQTVMTLITTLQTFIPALLLAPASENSTVGNVPDANRLYMVDVWEQYFSYSRYGYGSAMIVVFFVVILLLTAIVFRIGNRSVFYAVDPGERRKGG